MENSTSSHSFSSLLYNKNTVEPDMFMSVCGCASLLHWVDAGVAKEGTNMCLCGAYMSARSLNEHHSEGELSHIIYNTSLQEKAIEACTHSKLKKHPFTPFRGRQGETV